MSSANYFFGLFFVLLFTTILHSADLPQDDIVGCVKSSSTYNCSGNLYYNNNLTFDLDSDVTINVAGDFEVKNNFVVNSNGHNLYLVVGGSITLKNNLNYTGDMTAGGDINIQNNGNIDGNLIAGGEITLGNSTDVTGYCDDSNLNDSDDNCAGGGTAPTPPPVVEYRMDECEWDGTSEDVKDSSQNGFNATSHYDSTTVNEHKIGRSGYFDGVEDHVQTSNIYSYLKTTSTLSFWLKTTQVGNNSPWNAPGITGVEQRGGEDDIFWGWIDGSGKIAINKGNTNGARSSTAINDNTWHHVVLTRDADSGETNVYVDGTLEDTQTSSSLRGDVGNSFDKIGGITDTYGEFFNGYLDEVKIFDTVLNEIQVQEIYNNENSGKNYDGSDRDEISCGLCSSDLGYTYDGELNKIQMVGDTINIKNTYDDPTFTEKTYKDNFIFSQPPVIFILPDMNGNNPASMRVKNVDTRGFDIAITEPQGEDGAHVAMNVDYFAINQGVFKLGDAFLEVGTINTKAIQKGYDTAGNSWVSITPKVKFCDPVVLVQVQGMANEPDYLPNKRSEPFLSAVVDSNLGDGTIKIALEMGQTELGLPLEKDETIAYMIAESNMQSSFVDDANNDIKFETIKTGPIFYGWDDGGDVATANFVHSYTAKPLVAASINSRNSLDGGWFRKKTHNQTSISIVVDEDRRNQNPRGDYQDKERSKKKDGSDNTHTPEVGGIFAFEGKFIKNAEADVVSNFNALDEGQGANGTNLNTGYITTKIVSKPFKLDIISREDDNTTFSDANITKLEVVECADEACVDCKVTTEAQDLSTVSLSISNTNGYTTTPELSVNKAYKLAKVRITGVSGAEEVTVCSSDLFSIRPKSFELSTPAQAYASEDFNLNFKALNNSNSPSTNYNETVNSSFSIESNVSKPECNIGSLNVDSFSFTDGEKDAVVANYSNLGIVTLTIKENLGNEFAVVDKNDTNESDRLIEPYTASLELKPYELNVTRADMNSSTDEKWLYIADLDDMNLTLSATVGAFNKDGNILLDFNSTCYAKDVELSFDLNTTGNTDTNMNYLATKGSFTSSSSTLGDIDKTLTISASDFIDGKADASYALNAQREYHNPIKPFKVENMQVSVDTTTVSKNVNGDSVVDSFDFYFGRVSVGDVKTNKTSSVEHKLEFEVYDPDNTLGFKRNSLNWSTNEKHDDTKFGDLNSSDFTSAPNGVTTSVSAPSAGSLTLTHGGTTSATMHVDIDKWFWYVPFDCGVACEYKSYTDGGDCKTHPCFNYTYKNTQDVKGVQTGTFSGSDFNTSTRGEYKKTGVKVFR